jgi:phosphoribosylformylglycinamidine synthase
MEISLGDLPADENLSTLQRLYSESAGRFLVTVDPRKKEPFEVLFQGMAAACIGSVSEDSMLLIRDRGGSAVLKEDVLQLKECWKKPFGGLI